MTERMVLAVASPHVDILGHCTGRKVVGKGRPESTFDRRDRVHGVQAVRHRGRDQLPSRAPRPAAAPAQARGRIRLQVLDRHRRPRPGTARLAAPRLRPGGRVRGAARLDRQHDGRPTTWSIGPAPTPESLNRTPAPSRFVGCGHEVEEGQGSGRRSFSEAEGPCQGSPLAPPAPGARPGPPPEQAIDIPTGLAKTFRVTAGGTDAVMAVVMVRGDDPRAARGVRPLRAVGRRAGWARCRPDPPRLQPDCRRHLRDRRVGVGVGVQGLGGMRRPASGCPSCTRCTACGSPTTGRRFGRRPRRRHRRRRESSS